MSGRQAKRVSKRDGDLPPLPLAQSTWRRIAKSLGLSPQQKRIVELILRGRQDKEIADQLGLAVPTIRTYLKRIFDRVGVTDRLTLVLRIFALSQEATSSKSRHQ